MTAIALPASQNYLTRIERPGFSSASLELDQFLASEIGALQTSEIWSRSYAIISIISELKWNNSDVTQAGLFRHALFRAEKFLALLPEWVPEPDTHLDDDGDIWFEWNFGKNRIVSVALGSTSVIHYAALFSNGSKRYGTEMVSDETPDSIIESIKKAMG